MSEQKYYKMNIAGLDRELPICALNDKLSIAGFVLLGDYELTEACAKALNEKLPEHDFQYSKKDESVHMKYCACGENNDEAHSWDDGVETTPPTHDAKGEKTFTCTDCQETKTEELTELTDHSYTCKKHDANQHKQECICGDFYLEDHAWNDGEVTTEPTVETAGVKTYTCSDCGEIKTESIAKLPPVDNGGGEGGESSNGGATSSDGFSDEGGCSGTVSTGFGTVFLLGVALLLTKKKKF